MAEIPTPSSSKQIIRNLKPKSQLLKINCKQASIDLMNWPARISAAQNVMQRDKLSFPSQHGELAKARRRQRRFHNTCKKNLLSTMTTRNRGARSESRLTHYKRRQRHAI